MFETLDVGASRSVKVLRLDSGDNFTESENPLGFLDVFKHYHTFPDPTKSY